MINYWQINKLIEMCQCSYYKVEIVNILRLSLCLNRILLFRRRRKLREFRRKLGVRKRRYMAYAERSISRNWIKLECKRKIRVLKNRGLNHKLRKELSKISLNKN